MNTLKFTERSNENHNPYCDILELKLDTDSFITYGEYVKGPNKGKSFWEYYSGENYVVGSTKRSYSRLYNENTIPKTLKESANIVRERFNKVFKVN